MLPWRDEAAPMSPVMGGGGDVASEEVGLGGLDAEASEALGSELWGFDSLEQSTFDHLLSPTHLSTTPFDEQSGGGVPSHMQDPFPFDPDLFGTGSPSSNHVDPFGLGESHISSASSPTISLGQYPQTQHSHSPDGSGRALAVASEALEINGMPSERTLPRRRSRYFRSSHHHQRGGAQPVMIPHYSNRHDDDAALDPMQRWQDSPPEVEAASLSAIADALKNTLPSMTTSSSAGSSSRALYRSARRHGGAYSTSGGTSASSMSTVSSRSTTSNPNKARRRRGGRITKATTNPRGRRRQDAATDKERKPFQCTFCCDSFRTKYDWNRHETSLHLSLEKWVCSPHGGAVVSQATGRRHCAYCNMLDPSSEHLETHGHSLCHSSAVDKKDGSDAASNGGSHVFSRKDHLVQHLRLVHRLSTLPLISDWKVEAPPMVCRCGFCDATMHTWRQRADHLAGHFNEGSTMDDWRGGHGFEPAIEAQVMNALPPYTLGVQRRSFVPFSATCSVSRDQIMQMKRFYEDRQTADEENAHVQLSPSLGGLQINDSQQQSPGDNRDLELDLDSVLLENENTSMTWITRGMARFARRHMRQGVMPTDAMFQDEARRLIYGSEDGWEQTIADNEEWLANFRAEIMESEADWKV